MEDYPVVEVTKKVDVAMSALGSCRWITTLLELSKKLDASRVLICVNKISFPSPVPSFSPFPTLFSWEFAWQNNLCIWFDLSPFPNVYVHMQKIHEKFLSSVELSQYNSF